MTTDTESLPPPPDEQARRDAANEQLATAAHAAQLDDVDARIARAMDELRTQVGDALDEIRGAINNLVDAHDALAFGADSHRILAAFRWLVKRLGIDEDELVTGIERQILEAQAKNAPDTQPEG